MLGRPEEDRSLAERALTITGHVYGPDHPQGVGLRDNLAGVGELTRAITMTMSSAAVEVIELRRRAKVAEAIAVSATGSSTCGLRCGPCRPHRGRGACRGGNDVEPGIGKTAQAASLTLSRDTPPGNSEVPVQKRLDQG